MKLAVLIPAFNEEAVIKRAIFSAYRSGASPDDVYVVDDGSTDGTAEIAGLLNAQVLSVSNGGKASALRHGLIHFGLANRYEWLMILDADSILDDGYIQAVQCAAERHPRAALICGNQRSQQGNWLTAYRAVQYAIWCGIYREAQHVTGTVTVAPGFASTYRMSTFETLDFDAGTLVEDMDMTIQLQRRGEEIVYAPDAIVHTQDPRRIRDYIGQTMRWYRGTWQVVRLRRLGRENQRIDWEVGLLLGENLLLGFIVMLMPLWLWLWPVTIMLVVAADQTCAFIFTVLTGVRERRWDVIRAFPFFIIPRMLDYWMFAWAYLSERRQPETKWYSVARD